jgi:hypothetical protein
MACIIHKNYIPVPQQQFIVGQEYSQKTPYISITKINLLILLKERIDACCGYHIQHMNTGVLISP